VTLDKDGLYHIAAIDRGENVRLSEDFFIEARKDSPPTVKIDRPGRDAKVNPIENHHHRQREDDFALNEVALHYSVNGGAKKPCSCAAKSVKTASGKILLALEDYKLAPGDLVSIYADAKTRAIPPRPTFTSSRPSRTNATIRRRKPAAVVAWAAAGDDQQIRSGRRISSPQREQSKNGSKEPPVAADDA